MSNLSGKPKIHDYRGTAPSSTSHLLAFHCPGCGYDHAYTVGGDPSRPNWSWNGSFEAPVFKPSLLCNKDVPTSICHSFVGGQSGDKPSMIEFLGDCHHALRGQTVELPDWEE